MIIVAKQNYNLTKDDLNNIIFCNIFNTCNSLLLVKIINIKRENI